VKKIIYMCKKGSEPRRRMSGGKIEELSDKPRSYSFDKPSKDLIPKEEWQKLRRKNTVFK
jgi:hypothetical protein